MRYSGSSNYNSSSMGGGSGSSHYGNNSGNGGGGSNNYNRSNIDMPNLQSLGINPNGQNGPSNQGMHGTTLNDSSFLSIHQRCVSLFSAGMNMNSLPISPAIVAALNQWGLIGNMNQNQNPDQVKSNHNTSSMRRKRRL